jgi:ParB-like chromosome segregation protein Spo0J
MAPKTRPEIAAYEDTFRQVREVRSAAIEAYKHTLELHAQRRDLLQKLVDAGFSQADIARELGVTRQAIQKMLA